MPEGSGSLRIRMSKEENKGTALSLWVYYSVEFLGMSGFVLKKEGSSVGMWKMCLLAKKERIPSFLVFV